MKPDPRPALVLLRALIEDRAADLRQIATTENSWESWLQWEWWLRCKAADDLVVSFEPLYRGHAVPDCGNLRADLMLHSSLEGDPALVELAVVHTGNADSWFRHGKLEADRQKLAALAGTECTGVQVVVVASAKTSPETHPWWQRRAASWAGWSRPATWSATIPLEPGEAMVRAWW